ncbi:MAG: serine hydrolase [Marinilabiliaceae bacterium]|nr:serine hydrolase [Marinilabiliaceae bacterium]
MGYRFGLVTLLLVVVTAVRGQENTRRFNDDLSIGQKLAQLFITVDSLYDTSYSFQPGFLIETKGNAGALKDKSFHNAFPVLDVRHGIQDQLGLPFPQTMALQSINDSLFVDSLIQHTVLYSKNMGYGGLFGTLPLSHRSPKLETHLHFSVDSPAVSKKLRVVPFPANILKQIQYLELDKVQINANLPHYPFEWLGIPFRDGYWLNGTGALEVSFEDMLDQKTVFYTDQFSEDHQKLVRIYKSRLMDADLINQRSEELIALKTSAALAADSVSLENRQREQMVLRLLAMRKSAIAFERKALLPIKRVDSVSISVWDIRLAKDRTFMERARFYHPGIDSLRQAKPTDLIFVLSDSPYQLEAAVNSLSSSSTAMGSQKILLAIGTEHLACDENVLKQFDAIIVVHEKCPYEWCLLAQTLFGGVAIDGQLKPTSVLQKLGFVAINSQKTRLGFSFPEFVGMSQDTLLLINDKIRQAIGNKAMPGVQLLVARKGEIVLNQGYGHHKYNDKQDVTTSDLYDLASITKMAVTFPLVMKLYEAGKIDLDQPIGPFIPNSDTTDKKDITPREILLHQSGLKSYLAFHYTALDTNSIHKPLYSRRYSSQYNIRLDRRLYQNKDARFRKDVFQPAPDSLFSIRVSEKMFMNRHYVDSMYTHILKSELDQDKDYRYSDLGYLLLKRVIEKIENKPIDQLFAEYYAKPLGSAKLCFNPLNKFNKDLIAPTENDVGFRKELLQGYVHDQAAAMLGGVGAHAGLFSNAEDLAKMAQMLLNGGQYGGHRYLQANTINKFTSTNNNGSRRGMGVDKPEFDPEKSSPSSLKASPSSYGHSGFTGTFIWIDPELELVYIFLSNRVYPRAYNKKLIELNVRTEVQDLIYNAITN